MDETPLENTSNSSSPRQSSNHKDKDKQTTISSNLNKIKKNFQSKMGGSPTKSENVRNSSSNKNQNFKNTRTSPRYIPTNFDESDSSNNSDEPLLINSTMPTLSRHFNNNDINTVNGTSRSSLNNSPTSEEIIQYEKYLKTRVRYFFMTPCQKWKFKNRKPFKLSIQLMKIVLVTMQVVFFGTLSMETSDFISSNLESFRTLFLNEDLAQANIQDGTEGLALAEKSSFYLSINHARKIYSQIDDTNFDVFGTDFDNNTMLFCTKNYNNMTLDPSQGKYWYNPREINETCYTVIDWDENLEQENETHIPVYLNKINNKPLLYPFTSDQAKTLNLTVNFSTLIDAYLHFKVRTIRLKTSREGSTPDCIEHRIKVHYENSLHSGIIGYRLTALQHYRQCYSTEEAPSSASSFQSNIILFTILDLFCLCLCLGMGVKFS